MLKTYLFLMKKLKWFLFVKLLETTFFDIIQYIVGGIVIKNAINNIYLKNFDSLGLYMFTYCVSLMSQKLHLMVAYYINSKASVKIDKEIILKYFGKILNYDIEFFKTNLSGSITNKLTSMSKNVNTIYKTTYRIMNFCSFVIISFFVFCYYNYKLALFFVIMLAITFTINYKCLNKRKQLNKQMEKVKSETDGLVIDSFINILNIKLFNNQFSEFRNIKTQNNNYLRSLKKEKLYTAKNYVYSYFCFAIFLFGMMYITFIDYHSSKITIGTFVFIFQFIFSFIKWYKYLVEYVCDLSNHIAKLMSNVDIIKKTMANINIKNDSYKKNIIVSNGAIVFRNINFNYK